MTIFNNMFGGGNGGGEKGVGANLFDFKFEDYMSGLNLCKAKQVGDDCVLHTIVLSPGMQAGRDLIETLHDKATKPEFKIDVTALVQAFPLLDIRYKNKKFII